MQHLEPTEPPEIPFNQIDIDDVVTLARRDNPREWTRVRVMAIEQKDGQRYFAAQLGATLSGIYGEQIYKVVNKRGKQGTGRHS